MSNNANPSSDIERVKVRTELLRIIDEFICLSERNDDEDLLDFWVHHFFEPYGFIIARRAYSSAVAKVLSTLTANKKMRDQIEEISGDDDFSFFCDLLGNIVDFMNNIGANEAIMARLDKQNWELGSSSRKSIKELKEETSRYYHKLAHLKACLDLDK